jgi:hypothetical protein
MSPASYRTAPPRTTRIATRSSAGNATRQPDGLGLGEAEEEGDGLGEAAPEDDFEAELAIWAARLTAFDAASISAW